MFFSAYMEALPCYQQVLAGGHQRRCDHMYRNVEPLLYVVTAQQFYCQPHLEDSLKLRRYYNAW